VLLKIVLAGLAYPIFLNVVVPIIIWRTQTIPTNVKFRPIEKDYLISDGSEYIQTSIESIENLGFELIGSSVFVNGKTHSYFTLYWCDRLKVAAMVVSMINGENEIEYIEYTALYSDRTSLSVSNSPITEAYPKLSYKTAHHFPKIKSAIELLDTFKTLEFRCKEDKDSVDYDLSRGFGEIEDYLKKESDTLLHMGLLREDIDENGHRNLTLLGAFVLTVRTVFPGKNIVRYLTDKAGKRMLA